MPLDPLRVCRIIEAYVGTADERDPVTYGDLYEIAHLASSCRHPDWEADALKIEAELVAAGAISAWVEPTAPDDWFADVLAFHRKFGCVVGRTPRVPDDATWILRDRLIREEYTELLAAMASRNLPAIADGIADSLYVLLGTAVSYGIDIRPVFAAVHLANLGKTGGADAGGKITKGPDFKHPDVVGILARQEALR